jgi:hypothetical protein
MLQKTYIDKPDAFYLGLCKAAFPAYHGRKFGIQVQTEPLNMSDSWQGGSRDIFKLVRLADLAVVPVPAQSAFDRPVRGLNATALPAGIVAVCHSIFCGKDLGITVYVSPADSAPLLPAATSELTWAEKVVLVSVRSLKSSYNGVKNYRMVEAGKETGISEADYTAAKSELTTRGLLNKAGAITHEGRNAAGNGSLFNLRPEGFSRF